MDPAENAIEENRRLRRTMRDLVALSTLPAVWTGLGVERIARSLADVLLHTLSLDLIYIRLAGLTGEGAVEVVRCKHRPDAALDGVVRAAFAPILADRGEPPATIPDPFGAGTLNVAVTRFGVGDDYGVLVTGSRNANFPTEQDRLLLGVGANQTAIVVQRRRAEEQVRQQQEWLRVTLASIGDAVIATDTQGQVTLLNGVAQELTGWTQDEAQGRPLETVFVILNEQTRQPVESPVKKVLRDGAVVGLGNHTILVAKGGTERPIDDSAAPIRDASGKLIGVVLIFRDVTEQRRTERALREREQELRLVADHAPVFLVHCDRDARYRFVNKGYAERFGMTAQDVIGKRIADVVGEQAYARFREYVEAALAGRAVEFEAEIPYERIGPHVMRCAYAPESGPDGRVQGFFAVVADVTERKRAEEALRQSEERFARFMRSFPGLAWIKDSQGRYVYANDAALTAFGVPQPDLYGKTDEQVFPSRTAAQFKQHDRQAVTGGDSIQVVEALEHPGGALHHSLVSKFPIPGPDGRPALVGGMAIDISDRLRAEEALRRSEEHLRAVVETTPACIKVVAPDGTLLDMNSAGLAMVDADGPENVKGKCVYTLVRDEYRDAFREFNERVCRGEKGTLEFEIVGLRGTRRHMETYAVPLRWPGGGFVQLAITHDITARKRAEAALRHSEERFRSLMEQAPFSIQVFSPDGQTIRVNRAWEELWGVRFEQIDGYNVLQDRQLEARGILDHIHQGFAGRPARIPAIQYDPNETIPGVTQQDDPRRWLAAVIYPLKDADGRVREVVLIHEDITARKRAEDALRESEQRFRQLADAMPQIVWTAGPDGNIDYLNRRWTEFTGLPDTVGNEGWSQLLHPDEARQAGERWAASVRSGVPFEMEMRLLDRRQQTYRWHLIRTIAVHDGEGRVARWFGTGTDIDAQKRAEESARYLSEASAALASVVDYESTLQKVANLAVPHFADWSAVDVADEGGTLRRLAVAHQDPEKVRLAHELMREYPPDPHSPTGAVAVLRTGKPEMVREIADELLVRGAKDERHLGLIRSLGLKSFICVPLAVSGNTIGVLTFATAESGRTYTHADLALAVDLANRASVAVENTQLYQALRETDRRKDEFLATLAHELRNPLAPIRNALQILKMPRVDAATVGRSRDMMERQVEHLVRLVDDLLDVSRVMRGKIELRKERVELATVVARAVETVQPLVDAQGHQLSVRLPTESLPIDADPVRLAQVVGNLLTNAAKYTEAKGRIRLTGQREGGEAVLRLRDSGIGIAPDMLPHIFELFVQVDHAATRSQGGLGIGLTLVKNLVEMHHGTVEAHSAGLGRGSEFVIRLPISELALDPDHGREAGAPGLQPPSPSGHRLLVVDDNQDAAESLAMLLRLQGHEVRVAFGGVAALEMTRAYAPDVVFLDIGMPGMDGYEVARRLRQQPGLEDVVLAALTGWGQQEDRRRSAEAGFNHHLVKPPEPQVLEGVLAGLKSPRG